MDDEVKHDNEEQWIKDSKSLKSVYISGPITAESIEYVLRNIMKARRVYWWLLKHGLAVYCPHTMSERTGIRHERGVTHDIVMPNDLYWVAKCDIILMLPDYEESMGCMAELRLAKKLKKKIYYSKEELANKELTKKTMKEE